MRYKNVFVLSPGRSGSTTFAEACKHVTNYTSAHESLSHKVGCQRLSYPEFHIESDGRLVWFLGALDKQFKPEETLYVHLQRDIAKTTDSWLDRLRNDDYKSSIIGAFAYGVLMTPGTWSSEKELEISKFYVETVRSNIDAFIKTKNHVVVDLEDGGQSFDNFLNEISAEGDLDSARSTWSTVHNARAVLV